MGLQFLSWQWFHDLEFKLEVEWKHIKGEPLLTKKKMYNKYCKNSKLKYWWHPLAILNKSKTFKNLHDNILDKFILSQWLDEEDWIKSMYK
jgi:hypothetical protein